MRPAQLFVLAFVAVVVLLLALEGRGGLASHTELDTPTVAFPANYSETKRERISAVLGSKKCKFVRGHALNFFTTLIYQGDTQALNFFLEDLAKCPGLTIHVSFLKPKDCGHALSGNDWAVHHSAGQADRFDVRINLSSQQIELEKLYLPDIHTANE